MNSPNGNGSARRRCCKRLTGRNPNGFWLIICVLLAGAAALLVVPAMRHGKQKRRHARCVEQGFYQDRLCDLEQDEQQGVVAERPELVKELQQNLLNDIPVEQAAQAKPINRWALVPGVLLLLAVTVGFYLKTGGLAQVLDWRTVQAQMPELRERVANERAKPLSMEEIARLRAGAAHRAAAGRSQHQRLDDAGAGRYGAEQRHHRYAGVCPCLSIGSE